MAPLVSILTYSFNRLDWLKETIASVKKQKDVEWEMIILDNGSTPESYDELFAELRADRRFQLYRCEENGTFPVLLPSLAHGEHLTFLPDDDLLIGEDSLSRRVAVLEKNPGCGFVFSSVLGHDADGQNLGPLLMGRIADHDVPSGAAPFSQLFIDDFIPMPSAMWRRQDAELYSRGQWAGPSMDWALWVELSSRYDQAYLSEPCVSLRQHPGQDTHSQMNKFAVIHQKLWSRWAERGAPVNIAMRKGCNEVLRRLKSPTLATFKSVMAPDMYLGLIIRDDAGDDESHVLRACLDSLTGYVRGVFAILTSETGNHGTCSNILNTWCEGYGVQCCVDSTEWTGDFSEARNKLLGLMYECMPKDRLRPSYVFLPDCDEQFHITWEDILPHLGELTTRAWVIPLIMPSGSIGQRVNLIRWGPGWSYKGARHETLQFWGEDPHAVFICNPDNPAAGPHAATKHDGARSRNPNKMQEDIAALRAHCTTWRDKFFLAHNLARSGNPKDRNEGANLAISVCMELHERPSLKIHERGMLYCAHLLVGRLSRQGDYAPGLAPYHFLEACDVYPTRVEALGELAEFYCANQQWARARIYALACAHAPIPESFEFLETKWSRYRGLELLVVSLANLGQMPLAVQYLTLLSKRKDIPDDVRQRALDQLASLKESQQ